VKGSEKMKDEIEIRELKKNHLSEPPKEDRLNELTSEQPKDSKESKKEYWLGYYEGFTDGLNIVLEEK